MNAAGSHRNDRTSPYAGTNQTSHPPGIDPKALPARRTLHASEGFHQPRSCTSPIASQGQATRRACRCHLHGWTCHVRRKDRAFQEFARVLRPGGRISLFEPINRFALAGSQGGFLGYPLPELEEVTAKLRAVFQSLQPPDTDPMLDFDERDLIRWAEDAGFFPVKLTLEALVEPTPPREWHGFLNSSGNPNIPTVGEAMHQALTDRERERLVAHLRPLVENGLGVWRMATAYLLATKRTQGRPARVMRLPPSIGADLKVLLGLAWAIAKAGGGYAESDEPWPALSRTSRDGLPGHRPDGANRPDEDRILADCCAS
jgi:hypothetical protein